MPRESASSPGDGRGTKCPGSVGPYRPHRRPLCVRSAVRVRAKWEEQFHGCFASSQAGGGGEPGSGEVLPPPQRWVSASPPSSSREVASTRSSPHCRNWTFFILLFLKKKKRKRTIYGFCSSQPIGERLWPPCRLPFNVCCSVQTASIYIVEPLILKSRQNPRNKLSRFSRKQ